MPSVGVKLYSLYFKFMLNKRLQNRMQNPQADDGSSSSSSFGVTSRPGEESIAAAKPSFTDGVATKDIHIDHLTSLSIRIFLPDSCRDSGFKSQPIKSRVKDKATAKRSDFDLGSDPSQVLLRRNSYDSSNGITTMPVDSIRSQNHRRNSYACSTDDVNLKSGKWGLWRIQSGW